MIKNVFNRVVSSLLMLAIIVPVLFTTTGCGDVDNTAINSAIANSTLTQEIGKEFSNNAAALRLLWDMGIIDDATYYNAGQYLMARASSTVGTVRTGFAGTLGLGTVTSDEADDPADPIVEPVAESALNPFVSSVLTALESMPLFPYSNGNGNGKNCATHYAKGSTDINDWTNKASDAAGDHLGGHWHSCSNHAECNCSLPTWPANWLPAYGGYNTRHLVLVTDYKGLLNPSGSQSMYNGTSKTAKAFEFWEDGSALQGIVTAYNNLGDISIYILDPGYTATNQHRLHELPGLLRTASSRKDTSALLGSWYRQTPIVTGYKPPNWKEISLGDIYSESSWSFSRDGYGHEWTIKAKRFDPSAITSAITADITTVFQGAVLIGNKLFITHYDVAVLEGFYQVEAPNASAPVYAASFQHPSIINGVSGDTTPVITSASGGTITAPARYGNSTGSIISAANFPTTPFTFQTRRTAIVEGSGDMPFIEAWESGTKTSTDILKESIIVDVFDGKIIRKVDGQAGAQHPFMGFGDGTVLPSIAVAPAGSFKRMKLGDPLVDTSLISPMGTGNAFAPQAVWSDPVGRDQFEDKTYDQPLFVLIEYLELLYSPGIIGDEPLVAYGRKIRLDDEVIFSTSQPIPISQGRPPAYIVGSGITEDTWRGRETRDPQSVLSLTDFADVDGYFNTDGSKKYHEQHDGSPEHISSTHVIPGGFIGGELLSGDASAERSDRLPQFVARTGIECVMVFGSNSGWILASADANKAPTQTPLFGIVLHGNLYERGMFSNWINASGSAGLENWDSTTDTLGYPNYKISNAVLTEKLKGNYAFELNNDGLLSLDLETIIEINRQGIEDRRGSGVMVLRTILMILGFIMLAYVSLLIGCWAFDVNMDLGLNFLEKITFGHFVAVRSLEEMPDPDPESKTTYVDYKGVVKTAIIFACVGVILTTLDPVGLVIKLMEGLNFLFNEISKLIFGTSAI